MSRRDALAERVFQLGGCVHIQLTVDPDHKRLISRVLSIISSMGAPSLPPPPPAVHTYKGL